MAKNKFPIFVSEPTYEKKLDKILHNPYLNYCYYKLSNISGALVIYGHSMDETDTHIFEQVNTSSITDVYVSIYGDPKSKENKKTKAHAMSYFDKCNVHFFKAETTHIWA